MYISHFMANIRPVRRHVWRWTSERERDKSVFGVASMPGPSGFRDNGTGHARANVVTPPPTLVNLVTIGSLTTHQILAQLGTRILRYGDGGARAHVQRCPPHPWLVESTYLVTSNPHTKSEHNRSSRSWDTEARCARAHVRRYPTHELC